MLLKDSMRIIKRSTLPLLLLSLIRCAGSAPPLVVTTSSEFYMNFRRMTTVEERSDLVLRHPDIARKTFYDNIVLMVTDFSFKDLSPVEYDRAVQLGRELANLYEVAHGDTQLKETYERMMWDLER